jgi:tetratricopeptide (TPR) repeat protein
VIKRLVEENPGDPQYLRTYWLVLRAAQNWKEAIPAGQAYVAADPTAADSNFYFRMIADLAADSAFARAAEMASTATAKFPRSASLFLLKAQNERKAGQIPAAITSLERALAIDPKAQGAQMMRAQLLADQGKVEDAVAAVKADAAADPTNKERNAAFLVSLGGAAYRAAEASKKPEDFKRAIALLTASEEMSPSANAKFFAAVSAFRLVAAAGEALPKRGATCQDARDASNYLTMVTTLMPGGGSVSPQTAQQILGAMAQYQPFIDAQVRRLCR